MDEIQNQNRKQQSNVAGTQTSTNENNVGTKAMDKWLLANYDITASIYTFSAGLTLADLNQNGDYRLLIGDIGFQGTPKLKVNSKYNNLFIN